MRTATTIEASTGKDAVEFAVEAERLGLDVCWVAEAWGADAPSPLGYLAARTERMLLGSGVIQVGTRSPVTIAQTAMTLAHLSGGRFLLGLGVSGPQVMEGLHGIPFGHPLGRMRETVEIVRRTFTGERVTYAGRHYGLPLPGSKPMRVSLPPVSVPVYLATLSPKMLELTGEIADGWLGTSFIPERADAYFSYLDAGLARAGRTRAGLDVCQGAEINLVPEAELARTIASRKKELAFSLGGMGTATANFYNDAYSRQGWADVAAESATAGRRATGTVPPPWSPTRWCSPPRWSAPRTWCAPGSAPGAMPASTPFASTRPATLRPPASTPWPAASTWSARSRSLTGKYALIMHGRRRSVSA